ncbi:MAG: ribosome biogenesis GTPase Der [Proteobacteria bacterium]|nr:ribosome biogenesis GTPase Der [Pseudomonadota bacterium]MDA1355160.1 ribosome biogenesis GTPase Der [Pseudomonadota bacterium]
MSFKVAIVGRPNVGKSTLFNRLVGRRLAIVAETPGVTRDRREGEGRIGPLRFRVTDTAGLEEAIADSLGARMMDQTQRALAEADVALLVVDGRAGITAADEHFAAVLRRAETPVILVVNKCEGPAASSGIAESYGLGLGEPVTISAEHNEGINALYEALADFEARLGEAAWQDEDVGEMSAFAAEDGERKIRLAIVGRPNVGKSTLVNRLVGDERVITGPEAGITRDSVAVEWSFKGRAIELVDTAGLRRRSRVQEKLEKLSTEDTLASLGRAAVVVLLFDATEPPARQDLGIANRLAEEGRAPVIVLNKWDLVDSPQGVMQDMKARLEDSLPQLRGVPLVTCSALTGRGCDKLMPAVLGIYARWNARVPTAALNRWLQEATEAHPPPLASGRRVKLRYITQVKARPPTFAAFVSRPTALPDSYHRYLVNALRARFDLGGVPIRLYLRKGKNPYVKQ